MTRLSAFRRQQDGLSPLESGANGALCSEGELIVFETRTRTIPRLSLCGELLSPAPGSLKADGGGFVARFERLIDMWAGRTVFTLEDGEDTERLTLDIGPHRRKLATGAWEAMIEELSALSASLPWGMSPGSAGGEIRPDDLAPVHPAIIERELPVFRRLLRQLLADPPSRTLHTRAIRPLDISRGADLRTLRWLSRRPLELAGLRGEASEGLPPNPRALADQPDAVTSLDHPITRYVAWLLGKVRARLEKSAVRLRSPAGHGVPDPAASAYAAQLAGDVKRAAEAIRAVQAAPLFRAVRPEPLSDAVLQSLPDHPLYSAIHRVGRRLLEPGLAYAPGQSLQSALKHSYDLFELLVLYRLVAGLNDGLGAGWSAVRAGDLARLPREDRPRDRTRWIWRGPNETVLELHYQALFPRAKAPPDVRFLSSVSARGVPDYVLIFRRGKAVVSWLILDAKYRCGIQSILDAMGDMHRYRDALRMRREPAAAAYIITPSLDENAQLYGDPAFIEAHRLGALMVYEAGWMVPIWRWLREAEGQAK